MSTDFAEIALPPDPEAGAEWDRYGRRLLPDPVTGEQRAYLRPSSAAGPVEPMFGIHRYDEANVLVGTGIRPDLGRSAVAHRYEKEKLHELVDQAKEAAQASAASVDGTAYHRFAQLGDEDGWTETFWSGTPEDVHPWLRAYREVTRQFEFPVIEQLTALDDDQRTFGRRYAGTPDRVAVFAHHGERFGYIFDVKTGKSLRYGGLKFAGQLAIYARSKLCDQATGERREFPVPVSTKWGIVAHAPAGGDTCVLHWVDLDAGWEVVQLAEHVRHEQARKGWTREFRDGDTIDADTAIAGTASLDELRTAYVQLLDRGADREHVLALCEARIAANGWAS